MPRLKVMKLKPVSDEQNAYLHYINQQDSLNAINLNELPGYAQIHRIPSQTSFDSTDTLVKTYLFGILKLF